METWLPIPGFDDYEVSDLGQVRSLDRYVKGPYGSQRFAKGVLLASVVTGVSPYPVVNIHGRPRFVHALVMLAFVGEKPKGLDVCHMNGNRLDNRLENLAYLSRSENNRHIVFHGNRMLTVDQVRYIKGRRMQHGDQIAIERALGLSNGMVHAIRTGRLYAHV